MIDTGWTIQVLGNYCKVWKLNANYLNSNDDSLEGVLWTLKNKVPDNLMYIY